MSTTGRAARIKRTWNRQGHARYRTFNGRRYQFHGYDNKTNAKTKAAEWRRKGYSVRIVPVSIRSSGFNYAKRSVPRRQMWAVYCRKR